MPKIFRDMHQHGALGGVLLVVAALLAILVANSGLSTGYQGVLDLPISVAAGGFSIDKPLLLWVNDGLMALFFFLIGLEVKREFIEGHLSSPSQVVLPAIGAIAGVLTPALIYTAINGSDPITSRGWAVPAATDIAFALGVLSLFGSRVPISLKLFLLSVAIFDDIAAILIIALFYSSSLSAASLSLALAGLLAIFALNRLGIRHQSAYILLGIFVWAAVLKSGVHATLAGFAVALLIPMGVNNQHDEPMLKAMEHNLQPWVAYLILPVFAFANAGVSFDGLVMADLLDPVTLGIATGLYLGNQFGIFGVCWLTIKLGFARLPEGSSWAQLYGAATLCGIGFTMSLFIGSLAFESLDPAYIASVKVGVLLGSLLSAVQGSYIIHRSIEARTVREVRYEAA